MARTAATAPRMSNRLAGRSVENEQPEPVKSPAKSSPSKSKRQAIGGKAAAPAKKKKVPTAPKNGRKKVQIEEPAPQNDDIEAREEDTAAEGGYNQDAVEDGSYIEDGEVSNEVRL